MKPLLFLTARSFVNGVRRAFSSVNRLIGLILIAAYYFNFFFRSFTDTGGIPVTRTPGLLEFKPEVLQGGTFAIFSVLSLFLLLNSFNPRGGFRPADVDVLFATPVDPKVVLLFRICRDYLITLFIPLILAIIAGRSAGAQILVLLRHFPEQGKIVARLFSITYLLTTMCWVSIGYAISLFINRSDLQSDRNKKVITWTILIAYVSVFSYIGLRLRNDLSWNTALSLPHDPFVGGVFFTASASTAVIMAPFHESFFEGMTGLLCLLAVIAISIRVALSQIEYLYDQAAAKGFQSQDMRKLQRSGDMYGVVAAQAVKGKVRGRWFTRVVGRLNTPGPFALLWKEMILHGRAGLWQYGVFGPLILFIVLMPVWVASKDPNGAYTQPTYFCSLAFGAFMLSINNSQSGFIELLRRVDLQKPLPFSPVVTVFFEVLAKAVPTVVIAALAGIGATILDYHLIGVGIAGIAMAPSLSLVLASVALVVMVLFPDVDDAAQRGFRGMMMLLGIAIAAAPGIGVAAVLLLFHVHPLIVAIPYIVVNLAVCAGICAISGGLYSSYNPAE